MSPAPFRWWLIPLVAVGIAAVPNGILLGLVLSRPPARVDARAAQASARIDADKAARAVFAQREGVILRHAGPGTLHLSWQGPVDGERTVELLRLADARRDVVHPWGQAGELHLAVDPGVWRLRVRQGVDLLVDERIEVP